MKSNPIHNLSEISPFAKLLGVQVHKLADGCCHCSITIKNEFRNIHKALHGGVIYSIADIGMGAALYSAMESGENCTTIEIKINYLKPASDGEVECEARVIQKGKNIAVIEAEIKNRQVLIAKAIGTFSINRSR